MFCRYSSAVPVLLLLLLFWCSWVGRLSAVNTDCVSRNKPSSVRVVSRVGTPTGIATNSFECVTGTGVNVGLGQCDQTSLQYFGCEPDPTDRTRFYCCPQYCPDQSPIYFAAFTSTATTPSVTIPATRRCSTTSPQDTDCDPGSGCYQPVPEQQVQFCCAGVSNGVFGGSSSTPSSINRRNCDDQGADCPFREFLCNNTLYFDLMTFQCPSTCNRCPPDGAVATRPPSILNPPLPNKNCKDFLDCPIWVRNGFCGLYPNSTQADFCPIACRRGCALTNNIVGK